MRCAVTAPRIEYQMNALPRRAVSGVFRLWQLTVSPLYGNVCRYYPSCSHYGVEAVRTHGAVRGLMLTGWRVVRCNPWSDGGVDEVPAAGLWRSPFRRNEQQIARNRTDTKLFRNEQSSTECRHENRENR